MSVPTTTDAALLAGVPLLAGLAPDRLADLASLTRPVAVGAGELLFARGDPGTSLFVVVAGRVEVLVGDAAVRTHGPGEAFGELAVLTGGARTATVRAVRDTRLLELHRADVEGLLTGAPEVALALVRELARRLPGLDAAPAGTTSPVYAVVAAHDGLAERVDRLAAGLAARLGPLTRLGPGVTGGDPAGDAGAGGDPGGDPARWPALLDTADARPGPTLLVAPAADGPWARFCLRHADRPLLVADPTRRPVRPQVSSPGVRLVALGTTGLARWLDVVAPRTHHLLADDHDDHDDLGRLVRRETGRAVGVVLSGGGARGLAHIGVLDELTSAGVAIDRVAGTSMGAVVAGLFAAGRTPAQLLDLARTELVPRRLFGDVGWPRHGLIRGRRAEATLSGLLGDALVEEQRRRFFAVSTDLVAAEKVVHRRGRMADAIALSVRIPGIAPPRRVGARLHVDGGVLDNLPIGEMAAEGEGPVVGVDVAVPFATDPGRLPPIMDTIGRAMVIGSMTAARRSDERAAAVLVPRLEGFGLFDFGRLDELVERGRAAAAAALPTLLPVLGARR